MFRKLVVQSTGISSKVILLFVLAVWCINTGWSNPLPADKAEGEPGWNCDITNMHKKKSMPGHCYSYQQCQWKGIGDYDMEVVGCPPGRVFDENISECVSEKVLGFNFDKARCESVRASKDNKGPKEQEKQKPTDDTPPPPPPSPPAKKDAEPEVHEVAPPKKVESINSNRKKPMSISDMAAMSEQSMAGIESDKDRIKPAEGSSPAAGDEPLPKGKEPREEQAGQEKSLSPIAPLEPVAPAPPPTDELQAHISSQNRVPDVGNIKQPNFFKPFNNFPTATKSPEMKRTRVLSHEPLVKPTD